MSTTVTYKGQTLTTAENQTRTLLTAGKYMEGDLTITDVTQGGGGGGTTAVTFGEYANAMVGSGVILYVDDSGTLQNTTRFNDNVTINMQTGSYMFCLDNMDPAMNGTFNTNYITGLILVLSSSYVMSGRTKAYIIVFKVTG